MQRTAAEGYISGKRARHPQGAINLEGLHVPRVRANASKSEQSEQETVVPACDELFGSDAALLCFLLFEHVQTKTAQCGEVFGGMSGSCAAVIFPALDIQNPMQAVLNLPMAS